MTPSGALSFHEISQRRIDSYLWEYFRTSTLCRRPCQRAAHNSRKRKECCHTSAHCLVHAIMKLIIPILRKFCHSVSDSGKGSRRNLFPLRMGTALAQVPHSFFLLKLTLDTNSTAVGPQEVDEDVLLFRRVCGVPGRKVEVF